MTCVTEIAFLLSQPSISKKNVTCAIFVFTSSRKIKKKKIKHHRVIVLTAVFPFFLNFCHLANRTLFRSLVRLCTSLSSFTDG